MAYSRNTDYQNGAPYHPQGLHFQPPVPDTTYGPMTHIYVPRHDGVAPHLVPGGPAQVCNPYSSAQWPVAAHIQMGTRPTTALVPVQHASFVPSYSFYASRLLLAAPVLILFCFVFGGGFMDVIGWMGALFTLWLLVRVASLFGF